MTRPTEDRPAIVPLAQQAGEALARWRRVKPSAWTVRMLATLEQGVGGGKWFRLFDKVFSERNLTAAFQQVASRQGAAGFDHVSVDQFERGLPETIWEISDQLKQGSYQPQSIRRVHIPKPGTDESRPLGIPMRHSYCTSLQRGWGLSRERLALPWACLNHEAERRVQERRAGLRKRAMVSGVNRIHQGPCDVDWRPSTRPAWHQSAIVETVTLSKSAATLAEQRPSAR